MSDDIKGTGEGGPADWGSARGQPLRQAGLAAAAVAALGVGWFLFQWVMCRIEVPPGHLAVLIAKTGEDLPTGQIAAREEGQKGIQLATLKPGRHFRNPLFWAWEILPIVEVPPRQVGVASRLYGDMPDLEQNLLVPRESHQKGIIREPLLPGLHEKLNPMLHHVELHPATQIDAGFVGVVCSRVGDLPEQANTYLVGPGDRGVQAEVLRPGIHYLNPYAHTIYRIDVRSQRLELAGHPAGGPEGVNADLGALIFPSSDGFEIEVKLTVEWSIDQARAPEVFVRIGAGDEGTLLDEVLQKTLIPALRGNARIEGSKYPAANYISGESRTAFQTAIFESLQQVCAKQGIVIHSVMVNDIVPPDAIAEPIREREVAKEELARNKVQVQQAVAEQSLARETELVKQEQVRVTAETQKERRRIAVENAQRVALIEQEQLLQVAKADLEAAKLQAEAILARGQAEADVIMAGNTAQAEALARSVEAFGQPERFAAYMFALEMAPRVRTVFADPEGPFGALFKDMLEPGDPATGPAAGEVR